MHTKNFSQIVFLSLALVISACARRPAERFVPPPERVQLLRNHIAAVLQDQAFENAFWGVAVQSLDRGEMIFEQNANKLLMPASNMKLITAAASLKHLGSEFQYETTVRTDGSVSNGTLAGDLIIAGNGDPTISSRFADGNHFQVFDLWASQLRQMGISTIEGDVIAIDDSVEQDRIGYGWSWDDLPYYYATETASLQFAENAITVTIRADDSNTIVVQKEPDTSYISVAMDVRVLTESLEPKIDWTYDPESGVIHASGTLPPNGNDYGSFSVHNPAAYFATALEERLEHTGIAVKGTARTASSGCYPPIEQMTVLMTHRSPPLRQILSVLLKVSQNLYAETLVRTMGNGSSAVGATQIEKILTEMGIPANQFIIRDGSGLSRYNYVTPNGLLQLLNRMYRDPGFETFIQAMAVAGVDGTLRSRMKESPAANNVYAKTGSLSNVRALSGYTRTQDGEMIAFVLITNNFSVSPETVQNAQDLIVKSLASFSRAK